MLNRELKLITTLVLSLTSPMVMAGTNDDIRALVEQGKSWQSLGKKKQAADAWKKLLLIDPDNVDALYGMGTIDLEEQRIASAQAHLDKLIRLAPNSKQALLLEQDVRLNTGSNASVLEQARNYAQQNEPEKSVARFRTLFNGKKPQGRIALEYYQVLRTIPDGWEEAREGLERLHKEAPNDAWIGLIYAQTLTWKVPTRREGIRMLESLTERSDVKGVAMDSWRNALTLPGPVPTGEDLQLIKNYLAKNPEDAEIKKLLANGGRTTPPPTAAAVDPQKLAIQQASESGMKALEDENDAAAEVQFNKILASKPNDANALGGLGVIRMRQGRHAEARTLLAKAAKQDPTKWNQALNSASYWGAIREAQSLKQSRNLAKAKSYFEQASKLSPNGIEAQIGLAELSVEAGQLADAEKRYIGVLESHPENLDAIAGILSILMQTNRQQEASRLMANLPQSLVSKPDVVEALRKRYAESLAKSANAPNLPPQEVQLRLEEALRYEPQSSWIRMSLAYHYMNTGRKADARAMIENLLSQDPANADALYAHGLLASEAKRWDIVLNDIQRIPEAKRSSEALSLYRRAWINTQIDRANQMQQQSQPTQAVAVLRQLEPYAQQDPEMLVALSTAYMDVKENQRALELMRGYMMRAPQASTTALLQYANALTKANLDAEAGNVIQDLQRRNLTPDQRKFVDDMQVGMSIRRAESLRESGDLVAAYDALAPAISYKPNDPGVVGALARMYGAANDYETSLGLYQRLISQSPSDASLYISAAQMALQAKELQYAEQMADEAVRIEPDNSKIYTEAGRIYKSLGKSTKAKDMFTAAVRLGQQPQRLDFNNGTPRPANNFNPFVGLQGQKTSQTMPVQANYAVNAQGLQTQTVAYNQYQYPPVQQRPDVLPYPAQQNTYTQQLPAYNQQLPVNNYSQPIPPLNVYPANQTYNQSYGYDYNRTANAYPPNPTTATTTVDRVYSPNQTYRYKPRNTRTTAKRYPKYSSRRRMNYSEVQPQPLQQSYTAYGSPVAPAPIQGQGYYNPQPYYQNNQQPYYQNNPQPIIYPLPQTINNQSAVESPLVVPSAYARRDKTQTAPRTPQEELSTLMEQESIQIKAGANVRTRSGESGLGKLTDIQTPVEASIPLGEGKLLAQVTPVLLDAGKVGSSYDANSRFGGGPVATGTQLSSPTTVGKSQDASGVGLSVGYRANNGLEANIGTTPLGFQTTNMVGNVKLAGGVGTNPTVSYSVEANRRPVTDSVLSFAGTRDPRTGDKWGGVVATGGRVQLGLDYQDYGVYGYGSWHSLTGDNVADNTRLTFGGGAYFNMVNQPDNKVITGVNVGGMFFDKNLYGFTYGNGGYFSPQRYFAVTVPLTYAKRSDKWSYLLGGQLGMQTFTQDDADYFPTDAARQAQAITAALTADPTNSSPAVTAGQSNTGINFGLNGQADYQFAPNLFVGGVAGLNNAGNFHEYNLGVYLRYSMYPIKSMQELPVGTYLSPYAITY